VPVSEDVSAVYYQVNGTFAEGNHETGGLRLSKTYPDQVFAYWGNARYPNIKLVCYDQFTPADVQTIRVRFADSRATRAITPHK
jgi:hypothetical protein